MSWGSEYEATEQKEKPMRRIHLSFSVRGMLMQSDRELTAIAPFVATDGVPCKNAQELRAILVETLAAGYEYLPVGGCDNFDPKKGCLGHEVEGEP